MPAMGDFLARYPGITLHVGEDDRLVDLVREGVDCVLRAGVLQDSSLIGRQVALLEQVTVASPAYLERAGVPGGLDDLAQHYAVDYGPGGARSAGLDFQRDGEVVERQLQSCISVTGADLYTGAALSGLGLIQVPRYRIAQALAENRLRIVLADHPPPPMPVSVLYPQNRQLSARVRVFAQWLAALFERTAGSAASP
ncbi:MAG: LysR substrate-binding domain-containing protein, partial [Stenotrophomonas maltophilia]